MRPDGRIEKGQRLNTAISAKAWNRAQDAADIVLGATPGMVGGDMAAVGRASNVVLIKNESGQDVPACGVLRITGVSINPSGGTLEGSSSADSLARAFVERPVLVGGVPSANDPDSFVVTLEPIKNQAVGRAAIGGAFACRVQITNGSHQYAIAKDADVTQLLSSSCGPIQLLWKDTPGSQKWALGVM